MEETKDNTVTKIIGSREFIYATGILLLKLIRLGALRDMPCGQGWWEYA